MVEISKRLYDGKPLKIDDKKPYRIKKKTIRNGGRGRIYVSVTQKVIEVTI